MGIIINSIEEIKEIRTAHVGEYFDKWANNIASATWGYVFCLEEIVRKNVEKKL